MLGDVISSMGMIFVIALFFVSGVLFQGMVVQWGSVQNEAQSVAMIVSEQGGYTQTAESAIDQFLQDEGYDRSDTQVTVTDPGQAIPFGSPLEVSITVPYQFELGGICDIPDPLTGVGRAASSYISAGGAEQYLSPS